MGFPSAVTVGMFLPSASPDYKNGPSLIFF